VLQMTTMRAGEYKENDREGTTFEEKNRDNDDCCPPLSLGEIDSRMKGKQPRVELYPHQLEGVRWLLKRVTDARPTSVCLF